MRSKQLFTVLLVLFSHGPNILALAQIFCNENATRSSCNLKVTLDAPDIVYGYYNMRLTCHADAELSQSDYPDYPFTYFYRWNYKQNDKTPWFILAQTNSLTIYTSVNEHLNETLGPFYKCEVLIPSSCCRKRNRTWTYSDILQNIQSPGNTLGPTGSLQEHTTIFGSQDFICCEESVVRFINVIKYEDESTTSKYANESTAPKYVNESTTPSQDWHS